MHKSFENLSQISKELEKIPDKRSGGEIEANDKNIEMETKEVITKIEQQANELKELNDTVDIKTLDDDDKRIIKSKIELIVGIVLAIGGTALVLGLPHTMPLMSIKTGLAVGVTAVMETLSILSVKLGFDIINESGY